MDFYINIKPKLYWQAINHIVSKEVATFRRLSHIGMSCGLVDITLIKNDMQDDFQEYILFLSVEEQNALKKFIKHFEIENINSTDKAISYIADDVIKELKKIIK